MISILLFTIAFSKPCFSTIWVKDTRSSFLKFKSHLNSLDSQNITYAEHLLKIKREETQKLNLKDLVLKAQEYYLSGEISQALEVFKKITALSYVGDWNEEQRRAIFYAFLRRAQSEKNKHKKKALLVSASQFIMDKVTKDHPDRNLFPPPLLEELKQIQNQHPLVSIPLKKIFPHHEIILINGKKILIEKKVIQLPEASYRITALSSSHRSWGKVTPISFLMSQPIKTLSLSKGYCKTLKLKTPTQGIQIFSDQNCKVKKPIALQNFEKKSYKNLKEESDLKTEDGLKKADRKIKISKKKTDYKKISYKIWNEKIKASRKDLPKWALIGSAVLTTSFAIWFITKDKKNPSQPGNLVF